MHKRNNINQLTEATNLKIILEWRGEFNQLGKGISFNLHYRYL